MLKILLYIYIIALIAITIYPLVIGLYNGKILLQSIWLLVGTILLAIGEIIYKIQKSITDIKKKAFNIIMCILSNLLIITGCFCIIFFYLKYLLYI